MLLQNRSRASRIAAVALLAAAAAGCTDQPGLPETPLSPGGGPLQAGVTGQLQYFGYVGNGDDDWGLAMTKGFTNFAHVWARNSTSDPFVRDRVAAIAQKGLKATIDLGRVFWCDYAGDGSFRTRCTDWQTRWQQWKTFNAGILTPDRVLAFAVLDEPFMRNVNMAHYDEVTLRVKADFPWARIWLFEAACLVRQQCGANPAALAGYQGTLPGVDWLAVGEYAILPVNHTGYLSARDAMKRRFPGKGWMYVADAYWDYGLHGTTFHNIGAMRTVARQWYDVARADPDAVVLGMFTWGPNEPGYIGSFEFPCSVLLEHVAIGRAVTGKTRANTALPVGRLESVTGGFLGTSASVAGWATDPDGTVCENPRVDIYLDGQPYLTATYPTSAAPGYTSYVFTPSSGTGVAWRFKATLPAEVSGRAITAVARDLDAGTATLPSSCAQNPACVWISELHGPWGYMDGISSTGLAWGWVCDPDAPHLSSRVRLALDDGTPLGTFTTNLASEQAVADECGGGYTHRFQAQLPSWSRGRTVVAYALDLVQGEVQIPWIWPCEWTCGW